MNLHIFLNRTLLEWVNRLFVLVYTSHGDNAKRFNAWKYYLPNDIIENYDLIINGKNFYNQPVDSGLKRYEEIRKLKTGQGEGYTIECLLKYDYIKNQYRLISFNLSRQRSKINPTNIICWTIKKW